MRHPLLTRRHFLHFAGLATLTACGGSDATRKFGLHASPPQEPVGKTGSLAIALPRALKSLDNERIATRPDEFELQYFDKADWIDRAPDMLQMLIIRSMQNRTRLQVTAQNTPGPLADFLLTSLLQDFQAERRVDRVSAHIGLVVTLSRSSRRQIIATHLFEARAEAASDHMEAIVAAFDLALAQAMDGLIAWTLEMMAT
jgi:cholesterol transport system auxiliary component